MGKQRAAAKSMEGGVKSARKKLMADTAKSIVAMHKAAVAEKALMKKHAAFQKSMHALQKKMAHESAAAKAASGRRLAKYKKEMAANAKAIAAGKAKSAAIANAMKAANAKLAKDQAGINAHYKATMKALSAKNAANQKAFNAAAEKSQKSFAAKFAGNKAAAKTARINKRHAAEQAAKHKADAAYAKKAAADAAALRKSRAATAEKFAKTAAKADRAFEKDMQEAGQKKAKADRAAAEKKGKADEKETKASEASDMEIKECKIDGSECQTPDGKCHKTTPKGPFMGDDLVSCSKTKPAEEEDAGLSWAGIEPPLPAESCPPATAACHKAAAAYGANASCKAAMKKGGTKGIVQVGCHGGKAGLNAFFAWASDCCDPKNIGFSDNIPMFKMQITAMPVYKNSGTNGRFKANRGAGSVCTMVKSLAAGMSSGDDGGI